MKENTTEQKPVSIIIPAFNEEIGIKPFLDKLQADGFCDRYEIIVIDDGSVDSTAEIVAQYPVRLLKHHINKGYGAALKTGIRKAKGEKIIMIDSDGQHDPATIPTIAEMLDTYDLVIGERTSNSFQVKRRQSGKKLIRVVSEYLIEQKLPDYNSGLRGFHRELILSYLHLMPNGFSFSTTSTLAYLKEGYTIGTTPILVAERQGRPSSVKFIKDGSKTMLLLFRIIMLFNPLKIFFPASLVLTFLGLLWGTYGYFVAERFANSAILVTLMGVFSFFIGLLADQISILNRRTK
ncbi:MAG: glycosyltransferase family 2 protein [Bacteroidales bacterium]|nr:glycosyltransferase family 2 protein [Bacteroidales bacterium]MCF8458942.1 glycosyltransferase family 2 protein [Bacteroidales bacterium]